MFQHNLKNTTRRKLESQDFFKKNNSITITIIIIRSITNLEVSLIVLSH